MRNPSPASDVTALDRLIAKWREKAAKFQADFDREAVFAECGCFDVIARENRRCADELEAALAASREQPTTGSNRPAEWFVCFRCWRAFYVPTTGYFGNCDECGKLTVPWHVDPNQTLSLIEWRRQPAVARERPTPEPKHLVFPRTTLITAAAMLDTCAKHLEPLAVGYGAVQMQGIAEHLRQLLRDTDEGTIFQTAAKPAVPPVPVAGLDLEPKWEIVHSGRQQMVVGGELIWVRIETRRRRD